MSDLSGQRGEVKMVVTIKRKATGKEETVTLTSVVEGEDAAKAQRAVAELNQQPKEQYDGSHA